MSDNLHFDRDIAEGEAFQDFVQHQLAIRGMMFCFNTSKEYQLKEGESFGGIEVKYDRMCEKTGNVFIETEAESKDKTHFIKGGIYKSDNAWLYLIGNYTQAWLFSKKQLQKLWESQREIFEYSGCIIPKEQSYSKGFLITPKMLNSSAYVLRHFMWS